MFDIKRFDVADVLRLNYSSPEFVGMFHQYFERFNGKIKYGN
jgi:hypothetical protein